MFCTDHFQGGVQNTKVVRSAVLTPMLGYIAHGKSLAFFFSVNVNLMLIENFPNILLVLGFLTFPFMLHIPSKFEVFYFGSF